MNTVLVSLTDFYNNYPEFNTEQYKEIGPIAFRQAKNYFTIKNTCRLKDEKRVLAIYLLTAHLAVLKFKNSQIIALGNTTQAGIIANASVGEVSIGFQQIPADKSAFNYWLAQTPYGLGLLALLETLSSVPYYIGGSIERVF